MEFLLWLLIWKNWYITIWVLIVLVYMSFLIISLKNYWKYSRFLLKKYWFCLIGWAFNDWKTRLLSQIWDTAYENKKFILSNFYYWKSFLNFSSVNDLRLLINDLLFLWEYQNHSDSEIIEIYKNYWKDFLKEEQKKRKEFRKKYKYIPYNNKYVCNFVMLWDEFHQYFYSRDALINFKWENKDFLTTLHQVRHYNVFCALATQDLEDLDLKFRKLASYEIDTLQKGNFLFGFNLFRYKAKRNDDEKAFNKINRLPILKINTYSINIFLWLWEKRLNYIINKYKFLKYFFKRNIEFKRFNELQFKTKFNVNINHSIYKQEDLFVKLNDFFKEKWKDYIKYLDIV